MRPFSNSQLLPVTCIYNIGSTSHTTTKKGENNFTGVIGVLVSKDNIQRYNTIICKQQINLYFIRWSNINSMLSAIGL